jgi:quinol monooxygenase YgiN
MIVVIGSALIRDGSMKEAIALSLEHVHRSREEPGCVSHGVLQDCEDAQRLVFVEEWADQASLQAHFRVQASRRFVGALTALAVEPPSMRMYQADPISSPS